MGCDFCREKSGREPLTDCQADAKTTVKDHKQMASQEWIEHAYPLQQITVQVQGTRHSDRAALIDHLETVIARLRAGDQRGSEHDDDFGYRFEVAEATSGPSFFDDPAGSD